MEYDPMLQEHELQPFRKLFAIEPLFMASEGYFGNESTAGFRKYAVSYIEEISKCSNFDAFVPYLAMNYFDRFISKHKLPKVITSNVEGNARLLVICCLTIAWKMRFKSFKVDVFLIERGLQLDRRTVRKMELHILNALEWRMRALTPICFVEYFIPFLRLPPGSRRLNRQPVYHIIIRAQSDIRFTQFRPSIIAASAVLTASSKLFPAQSNEFIQVVSSCEFVSAEELLRCMEAIESKDRADDTMRAPTALEIVVEPSSGVGTSESHKTEPGEASSSVAAESTEARAGDASSTLLRLAQPPGADRRSGKEEMVEMQEIKPVVREIVEMQPVATDDLFMHFDLHWTDPQEPKVTIASVLPALSGGVPPPSTWLAALRDCCPILKWLFGDTQHQPDD